MKKRYICNALISLVTIILLISMVFAYIVIIPDKFSGVEKSFLEYITSELDTDGQLSFSAFSLIQGAFITGQAADALESDLLNTLVFQLKIILLLPYILSVLVIAFSIVKPRWSYCVTAGVSLVSPVVLLTYGFLYLPERMSVILDDLLSGPVLRLTYQILLGNDGAASFRSIIWKSLGVGYWIIILCSILVTVLSVAAFILTRGEETEEGQNAAAPSTAAILCQFGELSGARIPIDHGEEVKIGQDPSQCNLIASGNGILNLHCMIRFHEEKQNYALVSYGYTKIEGIGVVENGQFALIEKGTRIFIGNGENPLVLE
ncbi:MAG: FHA domain-containing protein [Clostridiales bacterium]|nr:FHA domain-containing protein [Clostridiales bacterium]